MKLVLGTRRSTLSLIQAEMVMAAVRALQPGIEIEIVEMKTAGDKKQGTPAASLGEKRDWIHELEVAVEEGAVDVAIHSAKDVPAIFSEKTELLPVLERANPHDLFLGKKEAETGRRLRLSALPEGAVIGCASLRRRAQLLRLRSDLKFVEHRGNVTTRLDNLEKSARISGIVLACAGLERLGLPDLGGEELQPSQVLPAINQGILAAQFRAGRSEIRELLLPLVDATTRFCFDAERTCVTVLNADCHSSVGIFAAVKGKRLRLTSRVLSVDGRECVEVSEEGRLEDAPEVGRRVATGLLNRGAARLILQASRLKAGHARR